jgi:hypothetical protein
MSEGEGPETAESHHDPQSTHVVRAVALVVVGVTLGVVLLHSIGRAPAGSVVSVTPTSTPSTTAPPATTTTTAAARPPAQVKALAANGTKTSGAANKVADTLRKAGYNVLAPTNATTSAQSSSVYYVPGFLSEAGAVAAALGLAPTAVMPLPTPSPVANMNGAEVVVVVGPDLAGQGAPATPSTSTTGVPTSSTSTTAHAATPTVPTVH